MSSNSSSRHQSIVISALIAIALLAWIASGYIFESPRTEADRLRREDPVMHVTVRHSVARETTRTITVSARTEPDRVLELKTETEGRVMTIGAARGVVVPVGQNIVELDMRDRHSRLAETEALIRQRQLEFEAAERLRGDEFLSPAELAAREAQLVAAQAARDQITLDIERTAISAPFDAIVLDRLVEIGDYVAVGDPIAQLVDADPIIVVGNVNERDVGALAIGSTGTASILGSSPLAGRIRYLAPVADEATRSFRVELAVPNPGMSLVAGTSAELMLGAEKIKVHSVPPSVLNLSLADDGTVGVKIVDETSRVRFVPVEIIESTTDAILVSGLPDEARIIVIGQGYVVDGQRVVAEEERAAAALTQAQNERPY
jgi:multidrug efflux system membrane fusion protein